MDSDRNVENKITPLYVLLPLYTELKQDIFLEILKKVVSRTRFGEDFIECAFTSGMTEKTLFIESKDLSMDCNGETSMSELVSLIGFWAVNNFPSLGRKLLGQSWQPSKERIVNIGNQDILDDKLIDATVFKKLKLRVIELSVSESTWTKVKHFVAVPAGVCDDNPERISKKMKMFSIKDAYIDDCWKALKLGKFITNDDLERPIAIEQRQSENSVQLISTGEGASTYVELSANGDSTSADSSNGDSANADSANADSANLSSTNGYRMVAAAKRPHVVIRTDPSINELVIGSEPVSASKRSRLTMDANSSDSAIDALRMVVENMTHEMAKLTNRFDSEAQLIAHQRNSLAESDRKNQELAIENGRLLEELSIVKSESDRKEQELAIENGRLLEELLSIVKGESDRKKQELAIENGKLLDEINVMKSCGEQVKKNSTDVNQKNLELMTENEKLQEHVNAAKCYGIEMEAHFRESDRKTMEMVTENGKLLEELNVMKSCGEQMKNHSTDLNQKNLELLTENEKLREQVNAAKCYGIDMETHFRESDRKAMEMVTENVNLLEELNVEKSFVEELKKNVAETNQRNAEMAGENQKLWLQINELRKRFETTLPELNKQIESLKNNVDETSDKRTSDVEDTCNEMSLKSAETSMEGQQLLSASRSDNGNALNTDELLSGNVQPSQVNLIEQIDKQPQLSTKQICESNWEPEFETDDPIVLECREKLKKLPFRWVKFEKKKKAKFYPGFIHPAEPGRKPEAQKVTPDGYITSRKYEFDDFTDKIEESERSRHKYEIYALKKFNEKFKSNFHSSSNVCRRK